MLSDKILRLKTVGDLDWWLLWALRSPHGRSEIERLATGNQESMRNIGQALLRSVHIPLAPEAECRRILSEIDSQLGMAEHNAKVVETSLRRCTRLRQSILKWAFEGKLVDQDPNDEPASALLARIKAEQPGSAPRAPRKRGAG